VEELIKGKQVKDDKGILIPYIKEKELINIKKLK